MARTQHDATRRGFLTAATGALVGAVLVGCAEESGDEGGADCPTVIIHENHAHVLEIPLEDIEAGDTKTYTLEGTHEHTLEVDALVFEKIETEGEFTVSTSTTDGHSHLVEIRLDPACLPAD